MSALSELLYNLLLLLISGIATWQIVEVTRHGEIFAEQRAKWEVSDAFFARMATCPFCLSVSVGAVTFIELKLTDLISSVASSSMLMTILKIVFNILSYVIFGFAASRTANLLNDVFYNVTRTAKVSYSETEEV